MLMRRSKEDTAKTRASIVGTASLRFRKNGICETGLADLMQAAGLTHGGFYRHFESKDKLVAEAAQTAFSSTIRAMQTAASKSRTSEGIKAIAHEYLSPKHRADRAHGCPLAALGSELARSDKATRAAATDGILKMIKTVASQIEGRSTRQAEKVAMAAVATMFGALVMSRIVTDSEMSDALLTAAKERLAAKD
jgi:TetR/AcrR family transcriptional regulator, transcriptional repressor for nem operon